MKYPYTAQLRNIATGRYNKRPILTVELIGPQKQQKIDSLVDSGADCSLFHLSIAQYLGFDLSEGISGKTIGINNIPMNTVRIEDVPIKIEGSSDIIKIPICFVDKLPVTGLLGQEGFFDQNRIKFEKDHDTFEVNPIRK